jgi:uncharacterized protein
LRWVAVALLLQLPQWPEVLRVLADPAYQPPAPRHWGLYGQIEAVCAGGSLADVLAMNAWTGQAAKWWWLIETARYPQMLGLFVCGLLIGRSGALGDPAQLRRLALRALVAGLFGCVLVWLVRQGVDGLGLQGLRHHVVAGLVSMLGNLAQMAVWAGGFVLLYGWARARRVLAVLAPYGRMSLTGYVGQALIGVPFFYGFGLAMYRYVGPFMAVGFGLCVFTLQWAFARWWLARYAYGPLEWLWRAATLRVRPWPLPRRTAPVISL